MADNSRRTTIILRPEDDHNLRSITEKTGTTDTEAIRRALKLMNELLTWERDEGGEIILQKGKQKEWIRFF